MSTMYDKCDELMCPADPCEPSAKPAAQPRRKLKIVVIDDNTSISRVLEEYLILRGYEVVTAEDGKSGLSLVKMAKPDVVICDIVLPGLNGYSIARAVRMDPALAHIFLISMSGYGGIQDVEQAMSAGFNVNLLKPVQIHDLESRLALAEKSIKSAASLR